MKNEIVLTEEQRALILEIFGEGEMPNAEKDLLILCCMLAENGIARRDLYNVLRVLEYESSNLNKMLNRIVDSGLLADRGDQIIWCPVEVKRTILPVYAVPTDMLMKIIDKLELETTPSMYVDALVYKPMFDMAAGVIDFVVEMHPDNIESFAPSFASLVYNYAMGWPIYGRFEIGIKGREETIAVRALRLAKENIEKGTAIYTDLVSLEAIQFVHGFLYEDAKRLLDEIENQGYPTTPLFMFAQGYFWETYGEYFRALYYYNMCYSACLEKGDDYLKPTTCLIISLLTSLLGDVGTSEYWMSLVHTLVLPEHHICRFYYDIINALNAPGEYFAEESLKHAMDCVCDVNTEAPILGRYYYSSSLLYTLNEQPKRAADLYKNYCHHIARFGSTIGGFYIYQAAEISKLVAEGNLLSCKRRLDRLDRVPLSLTSKEVALSVQIQTCRAYVDYFMAENNVLAKTYSEVALELLEGMKPNEEIVNTVVNDVFNGHLPSSLLESFYFDLMLLKWEINEVKKQSVKTGSLCRQNNAYKKVWLHIRELKERHSTYCLDIDVLAANLVAMKNPSNACKWWKETIDKAIGKDKYRIALTSAGYATEIGYIFEAKDMLQACYDDGFALLNIGERCVLLNELANTMELCGTRFEISKIWNESLALSEGTELQSKIYFSQAICAYNRSDYATALYLIDKCLKHYKPESSIYDETMASILTYRSICLSQEHQWSEAVIDIRNAMVFWPELSDLSSFNLFYDLAFYCIAQHQWNDAKQALEKIKAMAGLGLDDGQKQQIEDMNAILRMPLERRVPYVQTYYGDSFT